MHPQEESPLGLPLPLGSQLAPGSTSAGHKKPIDWGQLGTVPSAPTSATRQLPPSQLRGHRGWGGCPASTEHHPHQAEMAPTGPGTECTASCTPKSQVRLPSSVLTPGIPISKREWGTQLCLPCQGRFRASVSLSVTDPQAQGVILRPRLRVGQGVLPANSHPVVGKSQIP